MADSALAMRGLGWAPDVHWPVDEVHPDVGATVIGTHRHPVSTADRTRWRTSAHRASYRQAFADRAIADLTRSSVGAAATVPVDWVGQRERTEVPELLARAAHAHRTGPRYQRELAS